MFELSTLRYLFFLLENSRLTICLYHKCIKLSSAHTFPFVNDHFVKTAASIHIRQNCIQVWHFLAWPSLTLFTSKFEIWLLLQLILHHGAKDCRYGNLHIYASDVKTENASSPKQWGAMTTKGSKIVFKVHSFFKLCFAQSSVDTNCNFLPFFPVCPVL